MTAKQFFSKSLGTWESSRVYMYPLSGKIVRTDTYFTWLYDQDNSTYTVNWANTSFSNGSINIKLKGDFYLERDRGYFTGNQTISSVLTVSPNHLHTLTTYDGVMYDEYIEFLSDNTRFRRTVGYKVDEKGNKTGDITLVGTYVEKRVCLEEKAS
jgi:hypothetical protein